LARAAGRRCRVWRSSHSTPPAALSPANPRRRQADPPRRCQPPLLCTGNGGEEDNGSVTTLSLFRHRYLFRPPMITTTVRDGRDNGDGLRTAKGSSHFCISTS
ncbi:hypothetical protein CLOM_g1388, partial [Closterium sp. NIES-68]